MMSRITNLFKKCSAFVSSSIIRGLTDQLRNKLTRQKFATSLPKRPRHDDIYLVSYPRSGNTWVSFLIANVINEYLSLEMEVNFYNIHTFVPDIHVSRNIPRRLNFYPFRRIIKSHSNYNPYYNNIILLLRDPRDIMVSFCHYYENLNDYKGTLSEFIRRKDVGIRAWKKHTESWINESTPSQHMKLFYFEDFKENTVKQTSRLFRYMGFNNLDKELIQTAVSESNFKTMKILEEETHSYTLKKNNYFSFVRKGKKGEGKKDLSENDLNFIKRVAGKVMERIGYGLSEKG